MNTHLSDDINVTNTLLTLGVAALVYIGSWTLAGSDLAVGVTLCFSAGIVFASALAGSGVLVAGLGGSEHSWAIIFIIYTCFSILCGFDGNG